MSSPTTSSTAILSQKGMKIKILDGYSVKILAEILQNYIQFIPVEVNQDGLFISAIDFHKKIHLAISLYKENFYTFNAPPKSDPCNFGFNINHLYKYLKSIKKKEYVVFSIPRNSFNEMSLEIDHSLSSINIQLTSKVVIGPPTASDYQAPPHTITAGDLQKIIKDVCILSENINICCHKSFLIFSTSTEGIYNRQNVYGEVDKESIKKEGTRLCPHILGYLSRLDQDCDSLASPLRFHSTSGPASPPPVIPPTETLPQNFCQVFSSRMISDLLKLCGLTSFLHFYVEMNLPLFIESRISDLGKIQIFIKSNEQITASAES